MTSANLIKISSQHSKVLKSLLRVKNELPMAQLTKLALLSPNFCELMLDILFPKRRPPSVTTPVIHQCVRQIGFERVRHLFLCSSFISIFKNVQMPGFRKGYFWQDSVRRGFAAQAIAEELQYPSPYEAFIAGFASELGSLLVK